MLANRDRGSLTTSLPPHHRTYGSRIRRFGWLSHFTFHSRCVGIPSFAKYLKGKAYAGAVLLLNRHGPWAYLAVFHARSRLTPYFRSGFRLSQYQALFSSRYLSLLRLSHQTNDYIVFRLSFFQYRTNVKNERVVAQIVSEKQVPGKLIERKVFQMEFSSDAHWSQLCMPLRPEIRLRSLSVRPI